MGFVLSACDPLIVPLMAADLDAQDIVQVTDAKLLQSALNGRVQRPLDYDQSADVVAEYRANDTKASKRS
jgi:hypothetical protein